MGTDGTIGLCLYGTGYAARVQLQAYRLIPRARVLAVAGRSLDKARALAEEFAVPRACTSVEEAFEDDAIVALDIASALETHVSLCEAAARAGRHILCQKPFTETIEDAREVIDRCDRAGVRLMVNENWRWRDWYQAAKEVLASGRLGAVRYFSLWQRVPITLPAADGTTFPWLDRQPFFRDMPRFALLEMGTHLVDVARFLFGELTLRDALIRKITHHVAGEELADLVLESETGFGHVGVNWAARRRAEGVVNQDELVIEADEGTLFLDAAGQITLCGADGAETVAVDTEDAYVRSWAAAQRHFVECLAAAQPFQTDGEDNIRTLAVVLEAYDREVKRRGGLV